MLCLLHATNQTTITAVATSGEKQLTMFPEPPIRVEAERFPNRWFMLPGYDIGDEDEDGSGWMQGHA